MRTTIACCCLILASVSLAQQVGTIKGITIDLGTRKPIPFVNVYVRGSKLGTTSDSTGAFALSLPALKKMVVSFSHISYWKESYSVELQEGEIDTLTVELEPTTIELKGTTVTADYGRKPEDIFARVVTEKDIEERGYHSMSELLQWAAPLALNSTGWGRGPESILYPSNTLNFRLYWNGMEIDPVDVNMLDPYSVEKILVWYAIEAPMKYDMSRRQFGRNAGGRLTFATSATARYVIEIRTK